MGVYRVVRKRRYQNDEEEFENDLKVIKEEFGIGWS
jgi:hypothetical protein